MATVKQKLMLQQQVMLKSGKYKVVGEPAEVWKVGGKLICFVYLVASLGS